MKSITVQVKPQPYKIEFGPYLSGVSGAIGSLKSKPSKIFIITTQAVLNAGYPGKLKAVLKKKGYLVSLSAIPNGESHKNINTLTTLYSEALKYGIDRKSLVIAFGGGVVTDLAGFFSATFMRGISYISVPTTLLGMVDASIGGKTGVDLPAGKNLVGAFWQPRLVWIDQEVLKTLPSREWKTGFAEIIKYGVIKDKAFFVWLENKLRKISDVEKWPKADLLHAIHVSAQTKAQVVGRDVHESPLKGGREILNFGHTIGHALEAATVYGKLTHGEAISIGMAAVGNLAVQMKIMDEDAQLQMLFVFDVLGLPVHAPVLTKNEKKIFWQALLRDKKHISGKLRFVIPTRIGHVIVKSGIPLKAVQAAMTSVSF